MYKQEYTSLGHFLIVLRWERTRLPPIPCALPYSWRIMEGNESFLPLKASGPIYLQFGRSNTVLMSFHVINNIFFIYTPPNYSIHFGQGKHYSCFWIPHYGEWGPQSFRLHRVAWNPNHKMKWWDHKITHKQIWILKCLKLQIQHKSCGCVQC